MTKHSSPKMALPMSAFAIISALLASCGSHQKTIVVTPTQPVVHVVYSPGENLTSLSQVVETAYKCDYPFGGDNGKNLFFSVNDKSDNSKVCNIYRKDNPLSKSMSLLTGGNNHNVMPSYSQSIQKVAFVSTPENGACSDIYMVDALQGGALQQVTSTLDYEESSPCLSRDGKRIVYEKRLRSAPLKDTEIWLLDITTNENRNLGLGRHPSFSPDGRKVTFVKYAKDGYTNTYLCVMNADGSNTSQLTDASNGTVWHPRFSPDGRRIVFQYSTVQKNDFDLYVTDLSGNNLTQLTMNKSFDGEPYWANDGNIYFTSDRGGKDGHYQIWRFKYGNAVSQAAYSGSYGSSSKDVPSASYTYHTVSSGETITQIARQYGITVKDVVKWNNLTTMTLTPGMKLRVSQ